MGKLRIYKINPLACRNITMEGNTHREPRDTPWWHWYFFYWDDGTLKYFKFSVSHTLNLPEDKQSWWPGLKSYSMINENLLSLEGGITKYSLGKKICWNQRKDTSYEPQKWSVFSRGSLREPWNGYDASKRPEGQFKNGVWRETWWNDVYHCPRSSNNPLRSIWQSHSSREGFPMASTAL